MVFPFRVFYRSTPSLLFDVKHCNYTTQHNTTQHNTTQHTLYTGVAQWKRAVKTPSSPFIPTLLGGSVRLEDGYGSHPRGRRIETYHRYTQHLFFHPFYTPLTTLPLPTLPSLSLSPLYHTSLLISLSFSLSYTYLSSLI